MHKLLQQAVTDRLNNYFNTSIQLKSYRPLSGGSINQAFQLQTSHGNFFLKCNDARQFPGMFEAESRGLELLRGHASLTIPAVIGHGNNGMHSFLILEFIERGRLNDLFWENFGVGLARLHQHSHQYFGLDHENYIGSIPQSNKQHHDFVTFFVEERLEKQWQLAVRRITSIQRFRPRFERMCKRLSEILPKEPPALLHGDLWNGNYLIDAKGNAALIDPAAYYGHREIDLAMSLLFGGFDERIYAAYEQVIPLSPGWKDRVAIFNLYPLLVHVNLFGGGYVNDVTDIISRF